MKKHGKLFALGLASVMLVTGLVLGGCGGSDIPEDEVTVYMPDGAPALALAELMAKDKADDGVTYRVVNAETISLRVSGNNPDDNADFCVIPVNAASLLLGSGEKYQMLGLVTQGNMYLISSTQTETITDLSALQGETVGVMQIANVPGLTLKAALNRQNVAWRELKGGVESSETEVNLQGVTGVDGTLDYYLAPEPMVSTLISSGKFRVVGDLQKLYNGADSTAVGYPQAVLVAKTEFIAENAGWTKKFVAQIAAAGAWLNEASAEEIYNAVSSHFEDENHKASFTANKLGKETLARCGIAFAYSKDCYLRVDTFLQELTEVDAGKAKTVAQAFYWMP